jgi:2-methylcitrate dehydratase PrpD
MQRKNTDAAVRTLMSRVEVVHDASQEREPRVESARVTVTLKNGTRQDIFIEEVSGFPTHPMTHGEVEQKALELMTPRLGAARAQRLAARVWEIERVTDVGELVEMVASGG